MKVEQIYTECLAQGAYYIQSRGEVAVIDPLREVAPYLQRAENNNARIKYIFETHFHADFISGHLSLSKETGAPIIFGPGAITDFKTYMAKDGEEFPLGAVKIKVLHTPGHTMESSCFLLIDEHGKEHAIFSGDTLFLGDVGRPDLAQKSAHKTKEELAGILYDSLHNKIMPLSDNVIVYPGHGEGSACGKNMMKQRTDTLGNQKKVNYALSPDTTREDFIKEVTNNLLPPPGYFPANVRINKGGYESTSTIVNKGMKALSPDQFETTLNKTNAIVLDVHSPHDFVKAHIPKSIFIGLDGNFAPWVGEIVGDITTPILLVVPEGRQEEAITRMARIGFDCIVGFLQGGIEAWRKAGKKIDSISSIPAEELEEKHQATNYRILDVRKKTEYENGHIKGVENIPLNSSDAFLSNFPESEPFYIHCEGGYRSVIAASLLKAKGKHNPINIEGGFKSICKTNIPTQGTVCI